VFSSNITNIKLITLDGTRWVPITNRYRLIFKQNKVTKVADFVEKNIIHDLEVSKEVSDL